MKKLLLTAIALCSIACAEETPKLELHNHYWDVSVGPIPMPSVGPGIGMRHRTDKWGFDCGVSFRTLIYYNILDARVSALYYHSPKKNSYYSGVGLEAQCLYSTYLEPGYRLMRATGMQVIIGKEIHVGSKMSFKQLEISTPQKVRWGDMKYTAIIPDVSFRWGFGF